MSNLHNLQWVVIEIMSLSHHVTQNKHEKRQTMETKDTCFCEKSFIDISFSVLEILRGGTLCPPWLHKPKKPMVNRVECKYGHDDQKFETCKI